MMLKQHLPVTQVSFAVALVTLAITPAHAAPEDNSDGKARAPVAASEPLYRLQAGVDNCRLVFDRAKRGRVAYIGGSITAGPSCPGTQPCIIRSKPLFPKPGNLAVSTRNSRQRKDAA